MAWRPRAHPCAAAFAIFIAITGFTAPLVLGFSHLMGRDGVLRKFTLTSLELTQAVYPRAHTCFNRIDVPLYRTKEELVSGFEFVLELGDATFTMD